jgi:hypothetical protein
MQLIKNIFNKHKLFIIVFLIMLVPRLLDLGWDEWNVDAPRWQVRSDQFIRALEKGELEDTYQSYHPGVTLMWLSGISKYAFYEVFESVYGYKAYVAPGYVYPEKFFVVAFIAKFPLVFVISLLLAYSINLLYKTGIDKKYLYIFAFMISFEPFFLGITRFYHLTGLETSFVFSSFISIYYYLYTDRKYKNYLYLGGLFVGLGILTKLSAVIVLPFLIAMIFVCNYMKGKFIKPFFIDATILIVFSYLTFLILFPAAWFNPIGIFSKMRESGIDNIAFKDGPHRSILQNKYLYYYEIFFIKSLGLTFISLFAGLWLIFRKKVQNNNLKNLLLWAGLYILYYCFVLSFPSKQMTRYTLLMYPFALLISSYAIYTLFNYLNKKWFYAAILIGLYYVLILQSIYPVFSTFHSDLIGEYPGYAKIGTIYNDGEHYLQVGQYLNTVGGMDAYNYALVLPSANKDMSVGNAFVGHTFVKNIRGDKKFKYVYIAPDYYSLDKVPSNCEYVRGFGHRWPFKFDFLSLYKCPGN